MKNFLIGSAILLVALILFGRFLLWTDTLPDVEKRPLSPEIIEAQHASDSIRAAMRAMTPAERKRRDSAMADYLATQRKRTPAAPTRAGTQ